MMHALWEKMKEHPYIAIGVVVVVVLLIWMLFSGGGTTVVNQPNNDYASEVAAATQLQEAQLQAQTQGNQANLALQAQQAQYAAATQIAQLQATTTQQQISAQKDIASQSIAAQQESQDLQTSTYGQIQSNATSAAKEVALAGFSTQQDITRQNNLAQTQIYGEYFQTQQAIAAGNAVIAGLTMPGSSSGGGTPQNILTDFNTYGGYGTVNAANTILQTFHQPTINPWTTGLPGAQLMSNTWNGISFPQAYGTGGQQPLNAVLH